MVHRIVYIGTPAFACPALEALAAMPDVDVALTVTQPDRPSGRGRRMQSPPVKVLAESLGLPVYQTASLRTAAGRQPIVDARPDLIVVAAFGLILGRSILDLPAHGCVNLHASLLPRYRGASPIAAAILNGDHESGVTLMRMDRGLDTGPMYACSATRIESDDTTESLTGRLSVIAATLLMENLPSLFSGELAPEVQPELGVTLTRPLVKTDGWIDWRRSAIEIERRVRAMWPWPRAWTTTATGMQLQVHQAEVVQGNAGEPGRLFLTGDGPVIACGSGALLVRRGQIAGKGPMDGRQLGTLRDLEDGSLVGQETAPETPGPIVVRSVDEDATGS